MVKEMYATITIVASTAAREGDSGHTLPLSSPKVVDTYPQSKGWSPYILRGFVLFQSFLSSSSINLPKTEISSIQVASDCDACEKRMKKITQHIVM